MTYTIKIAGLNKTIGLKVADSGNIISQNGTITKDMKSKLQQTKTCIKEINNVSSNTHITKPSNEKKEMFQSLVRSIMAYKSKNWIINKKDQSKISVQMLSIGECVTVTKGNKELKRTVSIEEVRACQKSSLGEMDHPRNRIEPLRKKKKKALANLSGMRGS